MPIDASIYNNVQAPVSPLAQLGDLQKLQIQRQQAQEGQLKMQQAQQAMQAQKALNDSMKAALNPDGTFNHDAVVNHLVASGFGDQALKYKDIMTKADEASAQLDKTKSEAGIAENDFKGSLAAGVRDAGYGLGPFTMMMGKAVAKGSLKPEEAQQAIQMGIANPDSIKPLVDQWISSSPKQAEIGNARTTATARAAEVAKPTPSTLEMAAAKGDPTAIKALQLRQSAAPVSAEWKPVMLDGKPTQVTFDPKTQAVKDLSGKVIDNAGSRITPIPPQAIQVQGLLADRDKTAGPVTAARPDPAVANVPDPVSGLTPNAVYQNALEFATMNKLPPAGMGQSARSQAQKGDIQNKAAAIASEAGTTLPAVQAAYKANSAALDKIVPIATMTAASAGAAKDNLQLALDESNQVGRSPSKLLNKPWQVLQKEMTPAANLSKLDLYIYTAAREYAKVVSGSAASSVGLTDTAAKEAEKLLNASQSPETFAAVAEGMQNDMDNQTRNQTKQIGAISDTLGRFFSTVNDQPSGTAPTPKAPPTVGAPKVFNGRTYLWDGTQYRLQK